MSARRRTPEAARRRSGPTQPEDKRTHKQWLLRVAPEVRDMARDRARERGQDVSAYVSELVIAEEADKSQ